MRVLLFWRKRSRIFSATLVLAAVTGAAPDPARAQDQLISGWEAGESGPEPEQEPQDVAPVDQVAVTEDERPLEESPSDDPTAPKLIDDTPAAVAVAADGAAPEIPKSTEVSPAIEGPSGVPATSAPRSIRMSRSGPASAKPKALGAARLNSDVRDFNVARLSREDGVFTVQVQLTLLQPDSSLVTHLFQTDFMRLNTGQSFQGIRLHARSKAGVEAPVVVDVFCEDSWCESSRVEIFGERGVYAGQQVTGRRRSFRNLEVPAAWKVFVADRALEKFAALLDQKGAVKVGAVEWIELPEASIQKFNGVVNVSVSPDSPHYHADRPDLRVQARVGVSLAVGGMSAKPQASLWSAEGSATPGASETVSMSRAGAARVVHDRSSGRLRVSVEINVGDGSLALVFASSELGTSSFGALVETGTVGVQ